METANKLVYSKENYYTENGYKYKIKTTISLDDDCHNNMCDWSITADIRWKNKYGIYKEYMGGCCHDEIAKYVPELAKFIPLHCCNHYGAPMYPVENGMYHIKNSDKSVAIEYLRISDKEYSKLSEAVDDKMYFKYLLFNLGIVDRWKRGSDELIAELVYDDPDDHSAGVHEDEVRDDDYGVTLPNGTIERIIGGLLTFANEPIEIVTIKSHE